MGVNYANLASKAKKLIGSNGTKCILINPGEGEGEYNPATNEYDKQEDRFNGYCVISGYEDKLVDGTVIKAGDRKVITVLEGEPKPSLSKLEIYDKTGKVLKDKFLIINSTPVNPDASVVIVYKLQCRK